MNDTSNVPVEEQAAKGVKKTTRVRKTTSPAAKGVQMDAAADSADSASKPRPAKTTRKSAKTADAATPETAGAIAVDAEKAPGAAKARAPRSAKAKTTSGATSTRARKQDAVDMAGAVPSLEAVAGAPAPVAPEDSSTEKKRGTARKSAAAKGDPDGAQSSGTRSAGTRSGGRKKVTADVEAEVGTAAKAPRAAQVPQAKDTGLSTPQQAPDSPLVADARAETSEGSDITGKTAQKPSVKAKTAAKGGQAGNRRSGPGRRTETATEQGQEAAASVEPITVDTQDRSAEAQAGESGNETQPGTAPGAESAPRSRRSRSRRGRRKSAAARAAALNGAAAGETAEAAEIAAESRPEGADVPGLQSKADDRFEEKSEGRPREKSRGKPETGRGRSAQKNGQERNGQERNGQEKKTQAKNTQDKKVQEKGRGKQPDKPSEALEVTFDAFDEDDAPTAAKAGKGVKTSGKEAARARRKMFVSVLPGEQVEVVIAEEGLVQEYYVEMLHQVKIKGNIYKGVIHNVDPNLQAAFVSYGAVKNGFLQIDEVHPEYYLTPHEQGKGHKYPLIQKVLKPGQEILVQVVKEPSGTKGAFLTSYLSLPGRFLVLTPGREQIGVSRKVESEEERSRLRELLSGLQPGEGLGVIVRTVSRGATKTSLQKDLQLLKRVWKDVRKKGSEEPAPSLIYQELGLDTRAVRDYLTDEVSELWIDDEEMADQIREVVAMLFPRRENMVQMHKDTDQTLFERFGLKKQLEAVHAREVFLPSGGRLVFDHTEALMAIDINSGRAAGKNNFEDTAFKTNLEAAQQIPLQLRLRDIGGQIVIDFIEMRDRGHWREVEKAIRNGMKIDRARHDVGKISSFGLLEIVRQRLSSSAISITSEPCPCCNGTGSRRNMEWQSMQALREIRGLMRKNSDSGAPVLYSGPEELILYLLNNKKERLVQMEKNSGLKLELRFSLDSAGSCK